MQVKRYFAADMRQAMNRVREELGADAAIISTRRVAGGVELTAALDYQAPPTLARPNPALEAELRKTQAQIMQMQLLILILIHVIHMLKKCRKSPMPLSVCSMLSI